MVYEMSPRPPRRAPGRALAAGAASLALVAAVALQETVSTFLVAGICQGTTDASETLVLKWPNDLLLADAKLSGILLERADNAVIVGYGVAVVTQMLIFPIFGLQTTLAQNLKMGAVFTIVSLGRSYALRRLFERLRRL